MTSPPPPCKSLPEPPPSPFGLNLFASSGKVYDKADRLGVNYTPAQRAGKLLRSANTQGAYDASQTESGFSFENPNH